MSTKEELRIEKDKAKAKEQLSKYSFAEKFYSKIKDSDPEKQAMKQLANMAEEDLEIVKRRCVW